MAQLDQQVTRLKAENKRLRAEPAKTREAMQKAQADKKKYLEDRKALASKRTIEARADLEILEQTLEHTLSIDDVVYWEQLKDTSPFPEPRPQESRAPQEPSAPTYPRQPLRREPRFEANIEFLDRLIYSRRRSEGARAYDLYKKAHDEWLQETSRFREQHHKALKNHARQVVILHSNSAKMVTTWEKRRDEFFETQREASSAIDRLRERYEAREPEAIEEYCDLVLSRSTYPDWMPQEFEISYIPESSTLHAPRLVFAPVRRHDPTTPGGYV